MALDLLFKIASLFVCLLAGFLTVKLKALKAEHGRALSVLLLYVFVPCSVLGAFQVENTPEVRSNLLLAFIAAFAAQTVLMLLGRAAKKTILPDVTERMSTVYSNAGNIIIPLIEAALGAQYVIYTVAFISVQLLFLWTHCRSCMEDNGQNTAGMKEKLLTAVKKVLLTPAVIAIIAGLLLFVTGFTLPGFIKDGVGMLGGLIGPVSMIIIGMLLGGMDLKKLFSYKRVWLVACIRLLVFPAFTLLLFALFGRLLPETESRKVLYIVFLATASPAASTVTNMSQLYGRDADYAGVIGIVTTVLCIATMPLLSFAYTALGGL